MNAALAVSPRNDALRALARTTYRAHDARVGRIVAAFRLADRRRDDLPTTPWPLDDLRLDVLSYRWGTGASGEPRPRIPLAIYRPIIDLAGTGRVRFALARARDFAQTGARDGGDRRLERAALLLHRHAEQAAEDDWAGTLALPRLLLAYHPSRTPTPPDGLAPAGWDALAVTVEGLRAWPQELLARPLADGPVAPLAPAPCAAYAVVDAGLRGLRLANPAFALLRDRGLVPAGAEPKTWARAVAPAPHDGPSPPPGSAAARLLDDLEAYVAAEPGREAALRLDLAAACAAAGLPLPGGAGGEAATALLAAPWADFERPDAPRPQAIRLAGPPCSETARFATATVEADLGSLEPLGPRYRPVPRGVVAALLARGASRRDGQPC